MDRAISCISSDERGSDTTDQAGTGSDPVAEVTGSVPFSRRAGLGAILRASTMGLAATAFGRRGWAQSGSQRELVLGLVPALSPQRFVELLAPLADFVAAEIGIPIRMEGAPSFRVFLARLVEEHRYDIMLSGADLYYYSHVKAGYRAIVKLTGGGVRVVVIVPNDSDIRDISQLVGRRVATADLLTFSTRLGLNALRERGLDPSADVEIVVTQTMDAAMLSMLNGVTDAAIFMEPVLLRADAATRRQVRILAESAPALPHPISVGPRIDEALAGRLRAALLALGASPSGPPFFESMGWPGFVAAEPEDYASLAWVVDEIDRDLAGSVVD